MFTNIFTGIVISLLKVLIIMYTDVISFQNRALGIKILSTLLLIV